MTAYKYSDNSEPLLRKYKPPFKAECSSSVWTLEDADGKVLMEAAEDSYAWTQPVRELADLLNELASKADLACDGYDGYTCRPGERCEYCMRTMP